MNGIHATSVSVRGDVADLLGMLAQRDRGIYVSHLIEHRPPPVLTFDQARGDATTLRLRLSTEAREKLSRLISRKSCGPGDRSLARRARARPGSNSTQSRIVEGYVVEAWTETMRILRQLIVPIDAVQISVVSSLVGELKPSTPDGVYAAALFGKIEKRGVTYETTQRLVDSATAGLFLALGRVAPVGVEGLLAIAIARAYDEATAQARRAYDEARAQASRAYDEATAPASRAYEEATAQASRAYEEAKAQAIVALAARRIERLS